MNLPFKVGISPTLKIRGIIATENIKKGAMIERCPIVLIPVKQRALIEKTVLTNYYFDYSNKFDALVLGYGSLLNHSFTPNCEPFYNYKNKIVIIKAIKNINSGEELTQKYFNKNEIKKYPEYGIKI